MSYEPPSAPGDFTDVVRKAQHTTLVKEIAAFFTELARDEPMWPQVPDDQLFPALGEAIVEYAGNPAQLDQLIAYLQMARSSLKN